MKKSLLHNTNKLAQEAGASNGIIFMSSFKWKVSVNHQSLSIFWNLPNDSWTALIGVKTVHWIGVGALLEL
jgi:hypothetical protein